MSHTFVEVERLLVVAKSCRAPLTRLHFFSFFLLCSRQSIAPLFSEMEKKNRYSVLNECLVRTGWETHAEKYDLVASIVAAQTIRSAAAEHVVRLCDAEDIYEEPSFVCA